MSSVRELTARSYSLEEYYAGVEDYYYKGIGDRARLKPDREVPQWAEPLDQSTHLFPIEMAKRDELLQRCSYVPSGDLAMVKASLAMAISAHQNHYRASGAPYPVHFLDVAIELAAEEYQQDGTTISATLLHDTVEDTDLTVEEIRETISEEVAVAVEGMTKITGEEAGSETIAGEQTRRKIIEYAINNPRVGIIKCFDRLNYFRTLAEKIEGISAVGGHGIRAEIQRKIIETADVYAILAKRFGLFDVARELEGWCLHYRGKRWTKLKTDLEEFIPAFFNLCSPELIERDIASIVTDSYVEFYHRLPSPYDIARRMPKVRVPKEQNMYLHIGVILDKDGESTRQEWDARANNIHYQLDRSPNYYDVAAMDPRFKDLVGRGLVDSLRFTMRRRYGGLLICVHIYPRWSFELEETKMTDLFYRRALVESDRGKIDAEDEVTKRHAMALEKHELLKASYQLLRNGSRSGDELVLSSDMARQLEPRTPVGQMTVIGVDSKGREAPWYIAEGATVIDYAISISPGNWPHVTAVSINGEPGSFDRVLKPGDKIHIEFDSTKNWDPRWITAISSKEHRNRVRKAIRGIIKDEGSKIRTELRERLMRGVAKIKDRRERRSIIRAWGVRDKEIRGGGMYMRVLEAGRSILGRRAGTDSPLRADIGHAADIVHAWRPGLSPVDFLYILGMGYQLPEGMIEEVVKRLKEANAGVTHADLVFHGDHPGLLHLVTGIAERTGVNIIGMESGSYGQGLPAKITMYFDPSDAEKILGLIEALRSDEACLREGLIYAG